MRRTRNTAASDGAPYHVPSCARVSKDTQGHNRTYALVIRVKHGGNCLSPLLISDRALILSRVELLEIELPGCCFAAPQAKVVGGSSLVSRDWLPLSVVCMCAHWSCV